MDQTARLYRIKELLHEFKVVSKRRFLDDLEISVATFKRDLTYLRDRLNTPIEYDSAAGGYRLTAALVGPSHELPGVWFNADEIHALLTMQRLLQELQPGLLTPHVKPLLERLHRLLDRTDACEREVEKRIRVFQVNARHAAPKTFGVISSAVLGRRRLTIWYFHRGRDAVETRMVSPQRLTYYRDNWYLDAWCHLRESIRSFSLDAILSAELLGDVAIDIPEAALDAVFTPGYGIFSGEDVEWAVPRFSPERARWVSREHWHPQQKSEFEADGHYMLRVPYSDARELVMDILKYGPDVEVIEPEALRQRVAERLNKAAAGYRSAG